MTPITKLALPGPAAALLMAVLLAGCAAPAPRRASSPAQTAPTMTVRNLGEHFQTAAGPVKLIRVQDELRLIRCVKDGAITGCYADLGHLPRSAPLTTWYEMESAPGLKLAMLTPETVAVVQDAPADGETPAPEGTR